MVARLRDTIRRLRPSRLFVPHEREMHPDHRAAVRIVSRALAAVRSSRPTLLLYEVWTPLQDIDHVEDISEVMPDKVAAVRAYRTQCDAMRFDDAVVGLRFDPSKPINRLPLMADCPPANPQCGNSPNHAGKGQNVLFMDGHVEFCTERNVGVRGDDIFLNKAAQVAAGLDWTDSVLGRSSATPAP